MTPRMGARSLLVLVAAVMCKADDDQRLELAVRRHFDCPIPKRNAQNSRLVDAFERNRYVQISNSRDAPLKQLSPGCYELKGNMKLKDDLPTENLQLKFIIRLDSYTSKPEKCGDYEESGCGGVGSCLHCNLCQLKDDVVSYTRPDTEVGLQINGRPLRCGQTISANRDHELQIKFCMPTRKQFIQRQGISEEKWDEIWGALSTGSSQKIAAFVDVFLYDTPMQSFARKLYSLPESENCQAPKLTDRYQTCKAAVRKLQRTFAAKAIACHRVWGTLSLAAKAKGE